MNSKNICTPVSTHLVLSLNILLTITILFTFLTVFYIKYIYQVESSSFNHEIKNILASNLKKVLEQSNKANNNVKKILNQIQPILKTYKKIYSNPNTLAETNNNWLKKIAIFVSISLFVSFIIITFILKSTCSKCISLGHIIQENIILFVFVGIFEFWFFTNIASKYIPSPPSLMYKSAIESIKKYL